MKIWFGIEAIQAGHSVVYLSEIYVIKRNKYCLPDCQKKNFASDMQSDVYEPIFFKLGVIIGTTVFYILILM